MGLSGLFASAFLIGLTGAMMPGPMLTVTLERSARFGWLAGPLVSLGHSLLELLLIIGLTLGLGQLLTAPAFTAVIGILGGAVLVYLGFGIIKDAGNISIPQTAAESEANAAPGSIWSSAVYGVTTSLSNPYWLLWWGTVGAGYVALAIQTSGPMGLSAFYFGHILADFVWFTTIAWIMSKGGRFLPQPLFAGLLRILGSFLIFMAAYFIITGTKLVATLF